MGTVDSRRQLLEPRDHLLPVHGWWGDGSGRLPLPPPLLPLALSSAQWWGMQWPAGPGDLGRFWGRGPAPRELAWLALGLLVWLPPCGFLVPWPSRWPSTRMPSLPEPQACSRTPHLATWS